MTGIRIAFKHRRPQSGACQIVHELNGQRPIASAHCAPRARVAD
jgi:hypothetical protein